MIYCQIDKKRGRLMYWVSAIIFDEGDIKPWLCR